MPTFSVITITLNNLAGLKRTGESIQHQSCRDFEWIIIDGASTDGSALWLQTADAKWISEADKGIYDAMNKGLNRSNGEFMIFMNSGDVFAAPDTLARIQNEIENLPMPPDFVYGDSLEIADESVVTKPARHCSKIKAGMPTHHQAMLYRRAAIGDLRFDAKYKIAADYKFTAELLQKSGKTLRLGFPVCIFDAGGISQRRVHQGRNEVFLIRRELGLCGLIENTILYVLQAGVMILRRLFPRVYWKLRQSCGNSAGDRAPAQNLHDHLENQA